MNTQSDINRASINRASINRASINRASINRASINQAGFQDRVTRLRDQHAAGRAAKDAMCAKPSRLGWIGNLMGVLKFPLAFMLGGLSLPLGRYVQLHMIGLPDPGAGMAINIAPILLCLLVMFVIGQVLRFNDAQLRSAMTAGVICAVLGLHNLIHMYPTEFAMIYTPEWVDWQIAQSEPSSINLLVKTIHFN